MNVAGGLSTHHQGKSSKDENQGKQAIYGTLYGTLFAFMSRKNAEKFGHSRVQNGRGDM